MGWREVCPPARSSRDDPSPRDPTFVPSTHQPSPEVLGLVSRAGLVGLQRAVQGRCIISCTYARGGAGAFNAVSREELNELIVCRCCVSRIGGVDLVHAGAICRRSESCSQALARQGVMLLFGVRAHKVQHVPPNRRSTSLPTRPLPPSRAARRHSCDPSGFLADAGCRVAPVAGLTTAACLPQRAPLAHLHSPQTPGATRTCAPSVMPADPIPHPPPPAAYHRRACCRGATRG